MDYMRQNKNAVIHFFFGLMVILIFKVILKWCISYENHTIIGPKIYANFSCINLRMKKEKWMNLRVFWAKMTFLGLC